MDKIMNILHLFQFLVISGFYPHVIISCAPWKFILNKQCLQIDG